MEGGEEVNVKIRVEFALKEVEEEEKKVVEEDSHSSFE